MNGEQIQFISVTPEDLKAFIVEGVREYLQGELTSFKTSPESELMTREEVAEYLCKDVSTVYRMTKKGTLTAYGFEDSNSIYYKRSEINKALIKLE